MSWKYWLREFLRNDLLTKFTHPLNLFPVEMTDPKMVESLIRTLYPMISDKPLIRLGPKTDGGYLVPDDLTGIEACFSPGVSNISGFEMDCAELGIHVFLADRSVDNPPEMHDLFHFTKKFIGATSNDEFMSLDNWVNSSINDPNSDLLLQMDIEGFEYQVFLSSSDSLMKRFRIIVAEFHTLEQLWNRPFYNLAKSTFEKILQTHTCVHIHPNNYFKPLSKTGLKIPPLLEFTFVRNDRVSSANYAKTFPHPLDFDNTPYPSIDLPKCWYIEERT